MILDHRSYVLKKITRGQFLCAGRGRKPQICRWNCQPICRSSRDISISGFGGLIAISSCRSVDSHCPWAPLGAPPENPLISARSP